MTKPSGRFWTSSNGLAALALVAAAAYFLLTEHRAHVIAVLPWLILLACPLMHVFMHHGHGHGGSHRDDHDRRATAEHDDPPHTDDRQTDR